MLSVHGRRPAKVVVEPIATGLIRIGVPTNTVTICGAAAAILISVLLIPSGHLVAAAILTGVFAALDMVDGTMARLRGGGGTAFGATLDASCDRITDGALFAAIVWWMVYTYEAPPALVAATLGVLVLSQVISYVKARAEAGGIAIVGGLVERPERLIISLVGLGLQGFGVPYAIDAAIWVLLVGSVFTVIQRLTFAARSPQSAADVAAPEGA